MIEILDDLGSELNINVPLLDNSESDEVEDEESNCKIIKEEPNNIAKNISIKKELNFNNVNNIFQNDDIKEQSQLLNDRGNNININFKNEDYNKFSNNLLI